MQNYLSYLTLGGGGRMEKSMADIKKYKKNDGTTAYMFNAYVGKHPRTGKNVYRKRQGFKTKKQAEIAYANLITEIDENGIEDIKKPITFDELYHLWFDQIRLDVKGSTANSYRRWYLNYIKPYLGDVSLDKLSVVTCQKFVNDLRKSGINSYAQHRHLANQILRYAVSMEIIPDNPMRKTILPRRVKKETQLKFYTKAELEHFFNCLEDDGNQMRFVFFRVLAFTGVRKGEALGLQWEDIDFKNKKMSINKTVSVDLDGNTVTQEPKTDSSKRVISIDDVTLKLLKKWRMVQRNEYFQRGFNTSSKEQFIFTQENNQVFKGEVVTYWLNRILNKYDLPRITPHVFRHTHTSLLLQAGIPVKEVCDRLGHKDISITLGIYAHVMPEEKEKTAEKFANFVNF